MHLTAGEHWFEEVWNKGRREAIAELLPPDAVLHDGGDSMRGPEGFYPFYDRMRAAFSEIHVTIDGIVAEGEMECYRWSCSLRHTGDGLGFPATGKVCKVGGITMVRIANRKLAEGWQNWDMLGLMHQIRGEAKAGTYITAG